MHGSHDGFTLVELMVVVLIIGILVTIAVPVYLAASSDAEAKSCQANQRTILGAVQMIASDNGAPQISTAGVLDSAGSGWYDILVPAWIAAKPKCPTDNADYLLDVDGTVLGDRGTTPGFKDKHQIPQ